MKYYLFIGLVYWLGFGQNLFAQVSVSDKYAAINEDMFVNTKWHYTYATHAQSNTIIHKADKTYEYFLFFKYDYTWQMFLNGKFTFGDWELSVGANEVHYEFRRIDWWRIAEFTEETLILEFSMHDRAAYRYHFVRVSNEDAPFKRALNDLPDVDVDYYVRNGDIDFDLLREAKKGKRQLYKKRKELLRKKRAKHKQEQLEKLNKIEEEKEFLQVELVGGGFFGGIDPVYRNNLVIKTDGNVVKEFQTANMGLRVVRREISREALEELITFIEAKKFFQFERIYGCTNYLCAQRLRETPRPIALRLAITRGSNRKVIVVSIWEGIGKDNALINYPKELDSIVKAIENVALY